MATAELGETFAVLAARVRARPSDGAAARRLAERASTPEQEAHALPLVWRAAETVRHSAVLWQWAGYLARAVDDLARAGRAFDAAARIAPRDPKVLHGQARAALEAGLPAAALYARAVAAAPLDGEVLLGRGAALLADGRIDLALDEVLGVLREHPGWLAGQHLAAQLRWMRGGEDFTASLREALRETPGDPALWEALLTLLLQAEDHAAALAAIGEARGHGVVTPALALAEATLLSETGADAAADAAFAPLIADAPPATILRHVRHLLRTGRVEPAARAAEACLALEGGEILWPYVETAWRLLDDPRHAWLAAPELVQTFDLAEADVPLAALAARLRELHGTRVRYVEQSVRGGTQTDGPLLSRLDPEIRGLRAALVAAIERYKAGLPAGDARHPLLRARRDAPVRFSGSWSVRLTDGGFHTNHVHPFGWISSAFYVALPEDRPEPEGWLALGAPPAELGLALEPLRMIAPRPGRLALFPSYLWHGTRPFAQGERITVAFDVARPAPERQAGTR